MFSDCCGDRARSLVPKSLEPYSPCGGDDIPMSEPSAVGAMNGPESTMATPSMFEAPTGFDENDNERDGERIVEWEITLIKSNVQNTLGLNLQTKHGQLLIASVLEDGLVADWNRMHRDQAVARNTVIKGVNGSSPDASLCLAAIKSSNALRIKCMRVLQFTVDCSRDCQLGIDLGLHSMTVRAIREPGAIMQYNQACEPGYEILMGDRITSVNGLVGDRDKLFQEISRCTDTLSLTIVRSA